MICIVSWQNFTVSLWKFHYTQLLTGLLIVVIESHPDNAHEDLRLDRPFDGLQRYCDSLDLDTMNKKVRYNSYV